MATFKYCLFLLFLTHATNSAPRSKQATTTYDQKQTGEYNIQLHLKDFQIIAVVGEDSLGSLAGDYDYNYDYNDFTVKPSSSASTTTPKPGNTTTTTTSAIKINSTMHQTHHIAHKISSTTITPSTTKPNTSTITSTSIKISESTDTSPAIIIANPSQIPVIIQKLPLLNEKIQSEKLNKKVDAVTNVEIISNDSQGIDRHHLPLGEIFHYQKCSQGFTRDKSGRCRKLRRQPQIPLGFTRFANNLAAKFKTGNAEENLDDVQR